MALAHKLNSTEHLVSLRDEAAAEKEVIKGKQPTLLPPPLEEVEKILGYKFKKLELLEQALTHHSYESKEVSYERLEYVGDTVLNLLITKDQYFMYPDLLPGPLTRLRSANVDTEKLARVAMRLELHKFLRHRMQLLEKQIEDFAEDISKYPLHSNGLVYAPKVLADIVESIVGAVYIDSKCCLDTVWKVFKDLLEPITIPQTLGINPVTELYELCQKRSWTVKFENSWKKSATIKVYVQQQLVGQATYAVKKEIAEKRAAKDALCHIDKILLQDHNTYKSLPDVCRSIIHTIATLCGKT